MKPFNLQEALAGKPVVTRDGRDATHFVHYPEAVKHKVTAIVNGRIETYWATTGSWNYHDDGPSGLHDLFMATTKKTGWINIYKGFNGQPTTSGCVLHETKELAEHDGKVAPNWLSTAKLEWEE